MNPTVWMLAWKGFARRKGRFLISIIGFGLSVIIFILILTLLEQSKKSVDDVLTNTGTHFIAYKSVCCVPPFFDKDINEGFYADGVPSQPMPLELITTIKKLHTVKDASPYLLLRIIEAGNPMMIGGFNSIHSIATANNSCSGRDLIQGRFLQADDSNAVVLEQSFAAAHGLRTGLSFSIKGISFQIVGLVNSGVRPAKADVYMLWQKAEQVVSRCAAMPVKNLMNVILVESASAHVHQQAMIDVQDIIGNTGLISTYGCYKPASAVMNHQDKVMKLVFVVIFIFTTLLALKTQYASVNERSHDIGILSAMGWGRRTIGALVVYEAIIQAVIGAFFGIVFFIIIVLLVPAIEFQGGFTLIRFMIMAACLVLTGGITAGIIPAWNAARQLPAHHFRRI